MIGRTSVYRTLLVVMELEEAPGVSSRRLSALTHQAEGGAHTICVIAPSDLHSQFGETPGRWSDARRVERGQVNMRYLPAPGVPGSFPRTAGLRCRSLFLYQRSPLPLIREMNMRLHPYGSGVHIHFSNERSHVTAEKGLICRIHGTLQTRRNLSLSKTLVQKNPHALWSLGRLNHVAIAVPDLEKAKSLYQNVLGAKVSETIPLPDHGVYTIFVELGNTKLELLHPLGQNSPISGFLQKNKAGGMHHICIEVVSEFHRSQDIVLPSFCHNPSNLEEHRFHTLDVRRIVFYYLEQTKSFRIDKKSLRSSIWPKQGQEGYGDNLLWLSWKAPRNRINGKNNSIFLLLLMTSKKAMSELRQKNIRLLSDRTKNWCAWKTSCILGTQKTVMEFW
ncbi:unnamed protein product [Ranitomeya imitator]|uniref:VOC domain-containing protein n=1 Tax=Ranitomeya imitator TaxID=111125 RepID=A0ABN9LFR7_9NEOB|nr:unnamed protein product [Ranitomeya imitator]